MQNIESVLNNLSKSNFRSKFHLKPKDIEYINEKGMDKIREHAFDFISKRLRPETITNDLFSHPVV